MLVGNHSVVEMKRNTYRLNVGGNSFVGHFTFFLLQWQARILRNLFLHHRQSQKR